MQKRVAAIDGLRALAASAVSAYHLQPDWLPGGFLGVDVFLVLSGYLLTRRIGAEGGHVTSPGWGLIPALWYGRAARLLPLLAVTLLLVNALGPYLVEPSLMAAMREQTLAASTGTSNWAELERRWPATGLTPLWYLAVQLQLYLVWPPVLVAILKLPLRWRAFAAMALTVAAMTTSFGAGCSCALQDPTRAYLGTDTRFLMFGAGALLALAARSRGIDWFSSRARGVGFGVIGLALCIASPNGTLLWCGGTLVFTLAAVLAVSAATDESSRAARVLSLRPLVWLGRRSYGLYLLTLPSLGLVAGLTNLRGVAASVVAAGVCVVLAAAAFSMIERTSQRALMRLRARALPAGRS